MMSQLFNDCHRRDLLAKNNIVGFEKKATDLLVKALHFVLFVRVLFVKQNFLN